jgi:hypothetical protein
MLDQERKTEVSGRLPSPSATGLESEVELASFPKEDHTSVFAVKT